MQCHHLKSYLSYVFPRSLFCASCDRPLTRMNFDMGQRCLASRRRDPRYAAVSVIYVESRACRLPHGSPECIEKYQYKFKVFYFVPISICMLFLLVESYTLSNIVSRLHSHGFTLLEMCIMHLNSILLMLFSINNIM